MVSLVWAYFYIGAIIIRVLFPRIAAKHVNGNCFTNKFSFPDFQSVFFLQVNNAATLEEDRRSGVSGCHLWRRTRTAVASMPFFRLKKVFEEGTHFWRYFAAEFGLGLK